MKIQEKITIKKFIESLIYEYYNKIVRIPRLER